MTADPVPQPELCPSGKRPWDTAASARAALARIPGSLAGKGGKVPRRVYECPVCHRYHLTSRTSRR